MRREHREAVFELAVSDLKHHGRGALEDDVAGDVVDLSRLRRREAQDVGAHHDGLITDHSTVHSSPTVGC